MHVNHSSSIRSLAASAVSSTKAYHPIPLSFMGWQDGITNFVGQPETKAFGGDGTASNKPGGSSRHALLEDKVLARRNRLQQLCQFVQRWHRGPTLVPGIGIAGLGSQSRGGFG